MLNRAKKPYKTFESIAEINAHKRQVVKIATENNINSLIKSLDASSKTKIKNFANESFVQSITKPTSNQIGQLGENTLKESVGGVSQKKFKTKIGNRFVDNMRME